jgi:acyl carrier protein
MKKLIVACTILCALPFYLRSQAISKESIIEAGMAKYKSLSQEEVDFLVKNRNSQEVIEAIKAWENFAGIKVSKSAYAEIMAEYNVSTLSLLKYAVQKQKNIDEQAIRSFASVVLHSYLPKLVEEDTINEMVCFWTWDMPFDGFFESPYYRFHPDHKSTKMNAYGPVTANVYGFVQIECNVPEGEIFMDNVAQDLYTNKKLVVPVGAREFQIIKQGYSPCKQKVTIKKGKTEKLICDLALKDDCHVYDKLKTIIIKKLGVKPEEVTKEASLTNDLGADELDTVELMMEVEKEFNISIKDEEVERLLTVGQYTSFLIDKTCK